MGENTRLCACTHSQQAEHHCNVNVSSYWKRHGNPHLSNAMPELIKTEAKRALGPVHLAGAHLSLVETAAAIAF